MINSLNPSRPRATGPNEPPTTPDALYAGLTPRVAAILLAIYTDPGDLVLDATADPAVAGAGGRRYRHLNTPADALADGAGATAAGGHWRPYNATAGSAPTSPVPEATASEPSTPSATPSPEHPGCPPQLIQSPLPVTGYARSVLIVLIGCSSRTRVPPTRRSTKSRTSCGRRPCWIRRAGARGLRGRRSPGSPCGCT
jgi:hypothetical protein